MKAATISPEYVQLLLEGLILKGKNATHLLRNQSIPVELLKNGQLRISTLSFAKLSHAVAELLQDEAYGMLNKPMRPGSFALISRACLSCRNIEHSLGIYAKTLTLLDIGFQSTTGSIGLSSDSSALIIDCQKASGIREDYIVEAALYFAHRYHCWLARESLPIEKVELSYQKPAYADEYRYVFHGAPVSFNCDHNALYFSRKSLELPCRRTGEELDEMLKNSHVSLLTQPLHSRSIVIKVRLWMENMIRRGHTSTSMTEAAQHLELTEQTLRRHLLAEGASFKNLKAEVRRDIAMYHIEKNHESIEAIAFRLGFSEASSFIRAFKRWTGLTPLSYRKLQCESL